MPLALSCLLRGLGGTQHFGSVSILNLARDGAGVPSCQGARSPGRAYGVLPLPSEQQPEDDEEQDQAANADADTHVHSP